MSKKYAKSVILSFNIFIFNYGLISSLSRYFWAKLENFSKCRDKVLLLTLIIFSSHLDFR